MAGKIIYHFLPYSNIQIKFVSVHDIKNKVEMRSYFPLVIKLIVQWFAVILKKSYINNKHFEKIFVIVTVPGNGKYLFWR